MHDPGIDRRQLLGLGAAALLAALLPPAPAQAEESYEQTEARLKAAGVDDALRQQIHAAIERASAHLLRTQEDRGLWFEDIRRAPETIRTDTGRQAERLYVAAGACFAALALAHGGTEAGMAAARRAHRALLADYQNVIAEHVYVAGPFLMLADVLGAPAGAQAVSNLLASRGWQSGGNWTYGAVPGPNLSTSQFGMLGLWAAERMELETSTEPLKAHLIWLLANQLADGAWPYGGLAAAWNSSYPNGATMGLANLVLSAGMLTQRGAVPDPEIEEIRLQRLDALSAMRRYAPLVVRGHVMQYFPAWRLYDLFALEKACVFAGVERLGSFAWYVEGARRLVDLQAPDGSWSGRRWAGGLDEGTSYRLDDGLDEELVQVFDTAIGLLFLLRLSQAYVPPVITPSATPPVTTGPAAARPATSVVRELRRIGDELDDAKISNDRAIGLLDALTPLYDSGRAEGGPVVERMAIERLLVRALQRVDMDPRRRRNRKERVNIHAARLLAGTHRRVVAAVTEHIERGVLSQKRYRVGAALHEALFDVLIAFADEALAAQLAGWAILTTVDDRSLVRARTALCAVRELGGLHADLRRTVARRLVAGHRPIERLAQQPGNRAAAQVWRTLQPELVYACLCLLRSPTSGAEPSLANGSRVASVEDVRTLLGE